MDDDLYEVKEKFSKFHLYGMEDIDCGEALASVLCESSLSLPVLHAIKSVIGSVFFKNFSKKITGTGRIFFFYTPSYGTRLDYRKQFQDAAACAENTTVYESYQHFFWNWHRILKLHYIARWMWQMRLLPYNFGFRLYCCSTLFSGLMLSEESVPNENDPVPSLCVTFCDVHTIDYFITHRYNQLGIPSATLQHGVFGVELQRWPFLYSHSSYFLAINEFEATKYRRVGANGIPIPLGPLKYIAHQPQPILHTTCKKNIGVALGNFSDIQNEKLMASALSIAKKLGYRILFRCHPAKPVSNLSFPIDFSICYENQGEISTFAQDCDFVITDWVTSVISDLIGMGCPVFRLHLENSEDIYSGLNIPQFTDETSLEHLITSFINSPEEIRKNLTNMQHLLCPKGSIKEHYNGFFNKFDKLYSMP